MLLESSVIDVIGFFRILSLQMMMFINERIEENEWFLFTYCVKEIAFIDKHVQTHKYY